MTFEQWWSRHAIEKAEILPVLKLSFRELAKSAWDAALSTCTCRHLVHRYCPIHGKPINHERNNTAD